MGSSLLADIELPSDEHPVARQVAACDRKLRRDYIYMLHCATIFRTRATSFLDEIANHPVTGL
jgi:hypothetical protein